MPPVCTNQTNCCFSASSADELLVVYTADAHEWALYLRQILKSSRKLRKASIVLYAISPADQLHGYNFEYFQSCSSILVLVSGELLDTLLLHVELQEALQKLFYPPQRVVALLCGVSQDDVLRDVFQDWPRWRKVSAEDEPTVYISAILESITESMDNHTSQKQILGEVFWSSIKLVPYSLCFDAKEVLSDIHAPLSAHFHIRKFVSHLHWLNNLENSVYKISRTIYLTRQLVVTVLGQ